MVAYAWTYLFVNLGIVVGWHENPVEMGGRNRTGQEIRPLVEFAQGFHSVDVTVLPVYRNATCLLFSTLQQCTTNLSWRKELKIPTRDAKAHWWISELWIIRFIRLITGRQLIHDVLKDGLKDIKLHFIDKLMGDAIRILRRNIILM